MHHSEKAMNKKLLQKIDKNPDLKSNLKAQLVENYQAFLQAELEPTSIRVNTLKTDMDYIASKLKEWNVSFDKIPYSKNGIILKNDSLPLSQTLLQFQGFIHYQGIASQIPVEVLNPQPGDRILDMAASPGSKSTQIAAKMKNDGQLSLNDINRGRLQPLNANMQKSGSINNILLYLPGERYGNLVPDYFDKVLLDAPCTATGTLHDNPEIAGWWSRGKLDRLIALQERLLISAIKTLKPGGELVYSTCSILPEENEVLIHKLLNQYPLDIVELTDFKTEFFSSGIVQHNGERLHPDLKHAIRTYPHVQKVEGFFVIKLRKNESISNVHPNKLMKFIPTYSFNDKEMKIALSEVSEQWGIEPSFFESNRYVKTRNRIWLVNDTLTQIPVDGYMSAGLLFAEKKLTGWKLFNQSVQYLGQHITKRRLDLDLDRIKKLFTGKEVSDSNCSDGYYVLNWDGCPIASIFCDKNQLKLRLPHHLKQIF